MQRRKQKAHTRTMLANEPCRHKTEGSVCGTLWRQVKVRGTKRLKTVCLNGHKVTGKYASLANPDLLKPERSKRNRGLDCPKCGNAWAQHNDDGSCVRD
jgi:hypothetical protein